MKSGSNLCGSAANAVYGLLNPVPFGCFTAGLIFDVLYVRTFELQWNKGAAWLIAIGLLFAVIPRLINLVRVWITSRRASLATDKLDFWLNLLAIVVAIVNAFVHSRDAYGVVPAGVLLSTLTVVLLSIGNVLVSIQRSPIGSATHA
ncbi:DUF2231 domain-containing protein [Uliginosibacterium sp. H3]|uniref:DUF2231 domain-containing protein n=1 Tax=Uliginosibacterium silvisoli TaxID=3114758 RepID=A0ABU6K4L6_9RHOO|nr:DUF2231 domain-containing protein [Uliginosibacterium sp. H3]